MLIVEFIKAFLFTRKGELNPDGGIGGLTEAEDQQLSDLLNAGDRCECGVCACNNPLLDPNRKPGG